MSHAASVALRHRYLLDLGELDQHLAAREGETSQKQKTEAVSETSDAAQTLTKTSDAVPSLTETSDAAHTLSETSDATPTLTKTSDATPTLTKTSDAAPTLTEASDAAQTLTETQTQHRLSQTRQTQMHERQLYIQLDPESVRTLTSERRSDWVPTRTMAACGRCSRISRTHFCGTFWKEVGETTLKQTRKTSVSEYHSGRRRSKSSCRRTDGTADQHGRTAGDMDANWYKKKIGTSQHGYKPGRIKKDNGV